VDECKPLPAGDADPVAAMEKAGPGAERVMNADACVWRHHDFAQAPRCDPRASFDFNST